MAAPVPVPSSLPPAAVALGKPDTVIDAEAAPPPAGTPGYSSVPRMSHRRQPYATKKTVHAACNEVATVPFLWFALTVSIYALGRAGAAVAVDGGWRLALVTLACCHAEFELTYGLVRAVATLGSACTVRHALAMLATYVRRQSPMHRVMCAFLPVALLVGAMYSQAADSAVIVAYAAWYGVARSVGNNRLRRWVRLPEDEAERL